MSWRLALLVSAGLVAGIALGRATQDPDTGTTTWDASRAAGFAAYALLTASLLSGMALHLRYRPRNAPLTWLLEGHRICSALSLSFVAGHVFALLLDPVVHFSPVDAFVPLAAPYRPLQAGLGTLGLWLLVAVLASTGLAGRLPYAAWRNVHYLSFPAWALALIHGITAGTDSNATVALGVYAGTAAAVAAMLVVRIVGRGWVTGAEGDSWASQ